MYELAIGNGAVRVEYQGRIGDDSNGYRRQYLYTVTGEGFGHTGNDLHSGVGAAVDERAMMAALLGFLSAAAEAWHYGNPDSENRDLFPEAVAWWAVENSDELSMAEYDLEGAE